jgi:HSP20 family protein
MVVRVAASEGSMFTRKQTGLARAAAGRDPFAMLRRMTSELDRMFDEAAWPSFRLPTLTRGTEAPAWTPGIDVFEKNNRLVTKIDLPGMKKEDVKVEVTDGQLTISGERKCETEEKKKDFYRCEREYGSFYRSVPLPEGANIDDVKATFDNGVLEVSVPLSVVAAAPVRQVAIQEPARAAKSAA